MLGRYLITIMTVFIILVALTCSAFANPTRVIGGVDAERDRYPYQISLQIIGSFNTSSHNCGGSIINQRYILTAAHCMYISQNLRIKAGLLNLHDTVNVQTIDMESYIVHEDFDFGEANDIALIRLKSDLVFNKHVQPINLPTANKVYTGDVVLTGWGKTTNLPSDHGSEILQTVVLPLLTDEECATVTPGEMIESNICTGPLSGYHSICKGDSGGPIAQDNTIVGIVSRSATYCGKPGEAALYTEVSYFIDWINENMK